MPSAVLLEDTRVNLEDKSCEFLIAILFMCYMSFLNPLMAS